MILRITKRSFYISYSVIKLHIAVNAQLQVLNGFVVQDI